MSKANAKRFLSISAMIIAGFMIISCGTRGDIEKAPPLWGQAKKDYEVERAEKAQMEKPLEENNQTPKSN